jgi:hypothetical protein
MEKTSLGNMGVNIYCETTMHNVHHADLKTLLEVARPTSVLLIDSDLQGLPVEAIPADCRVTRLEGDILAQLRPLERFDVGVVANTLEHLDRKTAGILLARLRDLHTRRFVALAPIGQHWEGHISHWETTDFLGYGMTLMTRYQVDGKPLHLYHYAIQSYKTTPDWFNSQYWAHPERWKP